MTLEERPLPPPTPDAVFPPNPDHLYFEDWTGHPFRPDATAFEPVNAWRLADAALLAYCDWDVVEARLAAIGLAAEFFDGRSSQGFAAYDPGADGRFVILAFRGTEVKGAFSRILHDILADSRALPVDCGPLGKLHRGFRDALDEVWAGPAPHPSLRDLLARLDPTGRRHVWLTGHSLGAAVATLAAQRQGRVQGLYTFGSPRVGDARFAAGFHVPAWRFVNHQDVVPHLPPRLSPFFPYGHVGELKYIDGAGQVGPEPGLDEGGSSAAGHRIDALLAGQIPFAQLADHAPLYYALRCRNHYVRTARG
jgi:triacylglycerol lipase